jgi:hypothetical protein
MKSTAPKKIRREIFVLTPEEKRTVCFILIAFILGLATKHYRETHSPSLPPVELARGNVSASPNPPQKRVRQERPPAPK